MNVQFEKDDIFTRPQTQDAPFVFDDRVAEVFPDMVRRSIPGYYDVLEMTTLFASRFAQPNSCYYDLGCSLGASLWAMDRGIDQPNAELVGVDNSPAMIRRCKVLLKDRIKSPALHLICADVQAVTIANAAMVVLNYTLQFVPQDHRADLVQRIFNGLKPGGALLLSEKVRFEDEQEQAFQVDSYHAFKQFNGYSQMEISRKRNALENVLVPDTIEIHRQRLLQAGFRSVHLWFQYFNFVSLVAVK